MGSLSCYAISMESVVLIIGSLVRFNHAAPVSRTPNALEFFRHPAAIGTPQEKTGVEYCGKVNEAPIHTAGDLEVGPGFWITNNDGVRGDYFIYENSRDEHPWKYITIDNSARRFVQVCPTWQGHVARGSALINLDGKTHNLGTWFQASIDAKGVIWGGLSFLEGSDGGGSVTSTDGSYQQRGCTADILVGAPEAALATKGSGEKVLNKVVGEGASALAIDWMLEECSQYQVYIEEMGPNPVIKSDNGRFEWVFSKGKF